MAGPTQQFDLSATQFAQADPQETAVQCPAADPIASSTPGADINIRKIQIVMSATAWVFKQASDQSGVTLAANVVQILNLAKDAALIAQNLGTAFHSGEDAWDVYKNQIVPRMTQFKQEQAQEAQLADAGRKALQAGVAANNAAGYGAKLTPPANNAEIDLLNKYGLQGQQGLAARIAASGMTPAQVSQIIRQVISTIKRVNPFGDTNPNMCPWAAIATDNTLAGRPMTIPINQLANQRVWTTPEMLAILGGSGQNIPVTTIQDIINLLPPGGRGIVIGDSALGAGHVFNVINVNGLVLFVDGLTGELINPYYFPMNLQFIRTN